MEKWPKGENTFQRTETQMSKPEAKYSASGESGHARGITVTQAVVHPRGALSSHPERGASVHPETVDVQ